MKLRDQNKTNKQISKGINSVQNKTNKQISKGINSDIYTYLPNILFAIQIEELALKVVLLGPEFRQIAWK